MSEDQKPTYVVSALETQADGKRAWKTLLSTKDHEEANALVHAIEQDGVKVDLQVLLPRRKR